MITIIILIIVYLAIASTINNFRVPSLNLYQFKKPNKKLTILALFPHPDDETAMVGGTLAKYASYADTLVIVATMSKGEAWKVNESYAPEKLVQQKSTLSLVSEANLRVSEWNQALDQLNIADRIILDFGDGEMEQSTQALGEQVSKLFANHQPDVVITYDQTGMYGHPDHVALHKVVSEQILNFPDTKVLYVVLPGKVISKLELPYHMAPDPELIRNSHVEPNYRISFWLQTWTKVRAISSYKSQKLLSQPQKLFLLFFGGIEYFIDPDKLKS